MWFVVYNVLLVWCVEMVWWMGNAWYDALRCSVMNGWCIVWCSVWWMGDAWVMHEWCECMNEWMNERMKEWMVNKWSVWAMLNEEWKKRRWALISLRIWTPDQQQLKTCSTASRRIQFFSCVRAFCLNGWPDKKSQLDSNLHPYSARRLELSVEDHIVMWGGWQVIIPNDPAIRSQLLVQLHTNHPRIVTMKLLARSYFWWPRLESDWE